MATVLVVDDDQKILDMMRRTLSYEGFRVVTAPDGGQALDKARDEAPDVVILDWMLPGIDGIQVLKRVRAMADIPVLMLTAKAEIDDRVHGLESGADDYLVKPFAPAELLARVRALLRRTEDGRRDQPVDFAGLLLDPRTRETNRNGRRFELTPTEFELLSYFMRHPRQVLTHDAILQAVWGFDFGGSGNVLEVYVGYLRAKTESGDEPRLIQTVRGVGYVLREPS